MKAYPMRKLAAPLVLVAAVFSGCASEATPETEAKSGPMKTPIDAANGVGNTAKNAEPVPDESMR
jgi:hypothetical protein